MRFITKFWLTFNIFIAAWLVGTLARSSADGCTNLPIAGQTLVMCGGSAQNTLDGAHTSFATSLGDCLSQGETSVMCIANRVHLKYEAILAEANGAIGQWRPS